MDQAVSLSWEIFPYNFSNPSTLRELIMMSETIRKQMLVAEVLILQDALASRGTFVGFPSQEEIQNLDVPALEALKRELRDLSRSLGGVSGR